MGKKLALILVMVLIVTGGSRKTFSQEPTATYWNFAFNDVEFAAFSSDGTIHIFEGVQPETHLDRYERVCYQVGPQTALVPTDEVWYLLTPETAQRLMVPQDIAATPWTLDGSYGSYTVLSSDGNTQGWYRGVVVNAETGTVEWLTGEYAYQSPRFSVDGRYLYYASRVNDSSILWERELSSGVERAIFSWTMGAITPDRSGKYWLYQTYQVDEMSAVYILIAVDGTQREVGRFTSQEEMAMMIIDQTLVLCHRACEPDRMVQVQTLPAGPKLFFAVPDIDGENVTTYPLHFWDDAELLLSVGDEIWLVRSDGTATQLGFAFDNTAPALWTRDQRLIITAAEVPDVDFNTGHYTIWDREQNKTVGAGAYETPPFWFDDGYGALMFEDIGNNQAILYRYQDERLFRLPAPLDSRYFGITHPNGKTLYGQKRAFGDMAPGIYEYDPEADVYDLLLPGEGWGVCPVVFEGY